MEKNRIRVTRLCSRWLKRRRTSAETCLSQDKETRGHLESLQKVHRDPVLTGSHPGGRKYSFYMKDDDDDDELVFFPSVIKQNKNIEIDSLYLNVSLIS